MSIVLIQKNRKLLKGVKENNMIYELDNLV